MSTLDTKSFYTVLGVERTADERAIKKAYFKLVRQYPPETHPEEFKKIREAYEVLSDAATRREYDAMGALNEHGEEVGQSLRDAMQAMNEERYRDAQTMLVQIIELHPDLQLARDLLGLAYLHDKQAEKALALFAALTAENPTNAAYVLHKAYAYHALGKHFEAQGAYAEARKLNPEDVRPIVALADSYIAQKRWDEATRALDEAIHLDGAVDFRDFALFVRKIDIEIARNRPAEMAKVLAALETIIPEEPAARAWVANRLASLAAPLFAQNRGGEANLLMRVCAKLDPKRGAGVMPVSFEVDIEGLPEKSKDWLVAQNKGSAFGKIKAHPRAWPIIALLLGIGLAGLMFATLFDKASRYQVGSTIGQGLIAAGAAVLAAYGVLGIRRVNRSPYGKYIFLHPMFLLEVRLDHLRAWPLANVRDVRVTHRHTNGAYTGSTIAVVFAHRTFSLNIAGREASVAWANSVLTNRRRLLELMHAGLLEDASDATQFIPANLIPEEGARRARTTQQTTDRKLATKVYLAVATVMLAVAAVAIPINQARREARAFSEASGSVLALQGYLATHPEGDYADEARATLAQKYDEALTRARGLPDRGVRDALVDLVTSLKDSTVPLAVTFRGDANFDQSLLDLIAGDMKVVDPRPQFSAARISYYEGLMRVAISTAFDDTLGHGMVGVLYEADPKAAVRLAVHYTVHPDGGLYTFTSRPAYGSGRLRSGELGTTKSTIYGIGYTWECELFFGNEARPRYRFTVESEPDKKLSVTSPSRTSEFDSPYVHLAGSAIEDLRLALAERFGAKPVRVRKGALGADADGGDDSEDTDAAPDAGGLKAAGAAEGGGGDGAAVQVALGDGGGEASPSVVFSVGQVFENHKALAKAPWHAPGGAWTYFEVVDGAGKVAFTVGLAKSTPQGDLPIAFSSAVLIPAAGEAFADFVETFATTFHVALPAGGAQHARRPLEFKTAVLGQGLACAPDKGCGGKGDWLAAKWFWEDGEIEVFFDVDLTAKQGYFSEKDAEYRKGLVGVLAKLRDGT